MIAPNSEQFFFPPKEIENFKAKCYYFTKIEWWVHGHFFYIIHYVFQNAKMLI